MQGATGPGEKEQPTTRQGPWSEGRDASSGRRRRLDFHRPPTLALIGFAIVLFVVVLLVALDPRGLDRLLDPPNVLLHAVAVELSGLGICRPEDVGGGGGGIRGQPGRNYGSPQAHRGTHELGFGSLKRLWMLVRIAATS
jgi:hypothetical protein